MYTSVTVLALSSVLALSGAEGPSWSKDYAAARKQAANAGKPVAVFFGSGPAGYEKVARDGGFNAATLKALADNYVCCYVDVSTPAGQALAKAFEISKGVGLVLSDRTGKLQAFSCDGDLSVADLRRCLERFADPNLVVRTTVTDLNERTSYYSPSSVAVSGYNAAASAGITYGGMGYGGMGYGGMGYGGMGYGGMGYGGMGYGGMGYGGMGYGGMFGGGGSCPTCGGGGGFGGRRR